MKEQELQVAVLTAKLEAHQASLRSIGQSAMAFGKTEARVAAEKRGRAAYLELINFHNLSLDDIDWIRDNVPYVNDWSNPLESGSTLPLLDFGACSSPDNSPFTSVQRWRTGVIRPAFSQSQKADDDDEAYNFFAADDGDVGDSNAWPSNPNDRFKEDRTAEQMRMRNEKVAQRKAELNSHGDDEDDDATAAPLSRHAKGLQVGSKKKRKTGGRAQVLIGVSASARDDDDDEARENESPSLRLLDSNAKRRRVQDIPAGKQRILEMIPSPDPNKQA